MPIDARRWDMRRAAGMSLEQVKQWAKMAVAWGFPTGISMIAANSAPEWPVKDFSLKLFHVQHTRNMFNRALDLWVHWEFAFQCDFHLARQFGM